MMATDEMYCLLEPLLVSINTHQVEGSTNPMVDMYVVIVQRGLKTIEQVPARYREQVIDILKQLED